MRPAPSAASPPLFLGIEGGATHTVALLTDDGGRSRKRLVTGPANARLLTDPGLVRHLCQIARGLRVRRSEGALVAVGLGLAGVRTEVDRERLHRAAQQVWPGLPCWVGNDLDTALAAATSDEKGAPAVHVLVLSGTGSCCFGVARNGRTAKVGGWGHQLGDRGSAYAIGVAALRRTVLAYDHSGRWPPLGRRLLRALHLREPERLIDWNLGAAKSEVAQLAVVVNRAAAAGDPLSQTVLVEAATALAADASACARKLARPEEEVEFIFAGGMLIHQRRFARQVAAQLKQSWPTACCRPLRREGAWGAARLARRQFEA